MSSMNNGATVTRRPRRLWPWVLGSLALLTLLMLAGGVWALVALAGTARDGVHMLLDASPWDGWRSWEQWSDWDSWQHIVLNPDAWSLSLSGVVLALVVLFVVVPLAVVLAAVLAVLAVGLALGIALLVTLVSVAAALSPLLAVALLLWLLLREKPARQFGTPPPAASAGSATGSGNSTATASMAP